VTAAASVAVLEPPELGHAYGGGTPFGIHQIVTSAASSDAITNAALEFRELLRLVGPSEIYAHHVSPELQHEVKLLRDFSRRDARGVLLYHASIGDPVVSAFLHSRREPLVLVYHNITPARYFEPWDPVLAELLVLGRQELHALRDRVHVTIADSEYNAAELREIGYRDIRVVPPVINPRRLLDIEPDAGMLNYLDHELGVPFLLFVGQLAPHKRPDLLVDAMHIARSYLGFSPALMLTGPHRSSRYASAIISHVRELNLSSVHVVGNVPDAGLAAMFRRAQLMVTASEHEGFCVPLVEAMAFGLPVVATARAAIPEVVGDGGLLLPPTADSSLIAEAIVRVFDDDGLRADLSDRGRRRVMHFDRDHSRAMLLEAVMDVL
jgi:glycosyltransferase involved in cell wall biosynthesis